MHAIDLGSLRVRAVLQNANHRYTLTLNSCAASLPLVYIQHTHCMNSFCAPGASDSSGFGVKALPRRCAEAVRCSSKAPTPCASLYVPYNSIERYYPPPSRLVRNPHHDHGSLSNRRLCALLMLADFTFSPFLLLFSPVRSISLFRLRGAGGNDKKVPA